MIISISSQPIGGSYKNSQWRRDEVITEWITEPSISTIWQNALSQWWNGIQTQNLENLLTQNEEILETNQEAFLGWSDDLNQPSTIWENA